MHEPSAAAQWSSQRTQGPEPDTSPASGLLLCGRATSVATTKSPRASRLIGLRPTGRGSGLQNRRMGFDSPQPCARRQMPQRAPDHASDPGMDRRAGTGLTVKWPLDQHSGPAGAAEMLSRNHRANSTVTCSFAGRAIVQQRHCAHQRSVTRTDSSVGRAFGSHPKSPWFESRFVHLQVHQL